MTIKSLLIKELTAILSQMEISVSKVMVTAQTNSEHGDYSTNVALVAAKSAKTNPMALGENLKSEISKLTAIKKVEVVKPGFINIWLKDEFLAKNISTAQSTALSGKNIMVEFAHPNTHKAFHIGHLRNITTGESIVRLLESAGATVIRANYQGDVGMHIAKCLYGLLHDDSFTLDSAPIDVQERVGLLGKAYASGSAAYESSDEARKEIGEINKKIYAKDSSIIDLYQATRSWSLDYFAHIYERVDTHFDRYYFESESFTRGKQTVLDGLAKGVFVKSDGAIIFPGSKYGLHDRVFITGEGNPTYEGKDIGLAPLQFKEYNPDMIMHVVAPEQAGYFQVVFEALAQLDPETRGKEYHLQYGWVKLKHGKMSSRSGNVVLGEWLLDEAKKKILTAYEISNEVAEQVAVGAVKYSFLKVGLSQEIAFDLDESISLEGNSGPYLQYTYARTQSVLRKGNESRTVNLHAGRQGYELRMTDGLLPEEREVLRLLSQFSEVVEEAAMHYSPNMLCTYLFTLAQSFNTFYQKCPILKAESEVQAFRILLTEATGDVLKQGLQLLGIQAPKKM